VRGTGTHPPLTHTPRCVVIVANGSGPTQVVGPAGAVAGAGAAGPALGGNNPGGSQPPFQQRPPPIEANGFGVVHVLGPAGGAAGALGLLVDCDEPTGTVDGELTGAAEIGGVIPGGSQPPL
jgi:hypothetical protein